MPSARQLYQLLLLAAALAGCATEGGLDSRPPPPVRPESPAPRPEAPQTPVVPQPSAPPATLAPPLTAPRPAAPVAPSWPSEREGRATLNRLLPVNIGDRNGWATDILTAFTALHLPALPENLCATIAVIAQESSFQADPPVPGLGRIVWQEIDKRREKYTIPKMFVDLALLKTSPDGRSYRARIDALRTEREMNAVFDDMISELPGGKTFLGSYNPVRTGGPMQVSVEFAEEQVRSRPYPYAHRDTVRNEVFTRRGSVYFGIAMLLDYPAPYSQMLYRFADFNAGRYSSRNAAFQAAVALVSGRSLALDGDLLRYKDGVPATEASETQRALMAVRARLGLGEAEILRDLKLEKAPAFAQTALYQRLYALADAGSGERRTRELIPRIDLKSPKITRQLTTEWFAKRVDGRYRTCLSRNIPEG